MMEAIARGFFRRSYQIRTDGRSLAVLRPSGWREKARLMLHDGTEYELQRESMLGDFVLMRGVAVIERAEKPSALRNAFTFRYRDHTVTLRRKKLLSRAFVAEIGGREVGSISPYGLTRRRVTIDLPSAWPLSLRLFAFWLVEIIWRRQQRAAQ